MYFLLLNSNTTTQLLSTYTKSPKTSEILDSNIDHG